MSVHPYCDNRANVPLLIDIPLGELSKPIDYKQIIESYEAYAINWRNNLRTYDKLNYVGVVKDSLKANRMYFPFLFSKNMSQLLLQ